MDGPPFGLKNKRCKTKAYWNDTLSDLFNSVCVAETKWLKCKGSKQLKSKLKSDFCMQRKTFNKSLRKSKRRYQQEKKDKISDLLSNNPRDFWKDHGKVGTANERKAFIPMEIVNEDGTISNDTDSVIRK